MCLQAVGAHLRVTACLLQNVPASHDCVQGEGGKTGAAAKASLKWAYEVRSYVPETR